jgi:site-specific recombinase XerD
VAKLRVLESPTPQEALRAAVDSFYARCRARDLSHHALRFYRVRLEAFWRHLGSRGVQLAPESVTPAVIREFLASEQERVSAMTAAHSYITLRAFFRFLVREEWLDGNPMEKVEKVRVPRKVIETFSADQVEQMLAACNRRSFNGLRLRAIILTLLDCGLRVSELCGLSLEDGSWDAQTLRVMGKGSKERVVPFGEATRQALMAYLARRGELPGQDALFVTCYGDALNRHEVHRLVSNCGSRNHGGAVFAPHVPPHLRRHVPAQRRRRVQPAEVARPFVSGDDAAVCGTRADGRD